MKILLTEFLKRKGPGSHGYTKGSVADLMGVSTTALWKMEKAERPIMVTLVGSRVTRIEEKHEDKIWYEERPVEGEGAV